jgi:hypothetical protein
MSVIFHDGPSRQDTSLLKFMAEKTVEKAGLSGTDGQKMLRLRHREIETVAGMLRADGCFREAIRTYFGQDKDDLGSGTTLSERILDWVFGSRSRRLKHTACCDSCDAEWITKRGRLDYVAAHLFS